MPTQSLKGPLFAIHAAGRIGGHRRGWCQPAEPAGEVPVNIIQIVQQSYEGGNIAPTLGTTFVDIDATNVALTITTQDSWLLLAFDGSFYNGGLAHLGLDFMLDSVRVGNYYGLAYFQAAYTHHVHIEWAVEVAAGLHVAKMQWRASSTNQHPILYASNFYVPATLTAIEVMP